MNTKTNPEQIWELMVTGELSDAQQVLNQFPEILNDYFRLHAELLRNDDLTTLIKVTLVQQCDGVYQKMPGHCPHPEAWHQAQAEAVNSQLAAARKAQLQHHTA